MARLLPSKNAERNFDPNDYPRAHKEEADVYRRFNVKDDVADGIEDPVAILLEADLDGDGALSMEELTARLDGQELVARGQRQGPPQSKWSRSLVGAAGVAAVAVMTAALTRTSPMRRHRERIPTSIPGHRGGGPAAPAPAWFTFLHVGKRSRHLS